MRDGTFATRVLHSWIVSQAAQRPLTCASSFLLRLCFGVGRLLASVPGPETTACLPASELVGWPTQVPHAHRSGEK